MKHVKKLKLNEEITFEQEDILETIKEDRENIVAAWAGGNYTAESADGTVQLNAEALGNLKAIENILITLSEYEETFDYMEAD